jgi:hypothetical protein
MVLQAFNRILLVPILNNSFTTSPTRLNGFLIPTIHHSIPNHYHSRRVSLQPSLALYEVGELESDLRNPGEDEVMDRIELEADAEGEIVLITQLVDVPQCE